MGALVDLKAFYSQAEMDDIPKAALQAGVFKDTLATVPWQLGSIAVMGWKSVMAKAGLKEQIPETWPEFKDAVRKASMAYRGDLGARTSKDANSAYWLFPVMWGHGGEFEDAQGKIVFNNPGTVAALESYGDRHRQAVARGHDGARGQEPDAPEQAGLHLRRPLDEGHLPQPERAGPGGGRQIHRRPLPQGRGRQALRHRQRPRPVRLHAEQASGRKPWNW